MVERDGKKSSYENSDSLGYSINLVKMYTLDVSLNNKESAQCEKHHHWSTRIYSIGSHEEILSASD